METLIFEESRSGRRAFAQAPGMELLDDPARLRRMGAAGRERALTVFGVDAHVDRMLEIYRGL